MVSNLSHTTPRSKVTSYRRISKVTRPGTIEFMVYADEKLIAETGVVAVDETGFIDVEIPAGSRQIRLVALQGADGMSFDHADWANAGFILK